MGIPNEGTLTHPAGLEPVHPLAFDDPDTPIEGPGGPEDGTAQPEHTPPPPPECTP